MEVVQVEAVGGLEAGQQAAVAISLSHEILDEADELDERVDSLSAVPAPPQLFRVLHQVLKPDQLARDVLLEVAPDLLLAAPDEAVVGVAVVTARNLLLVQKSGLDLLDRKVHSCYAVLILENRNLPYRDLSVISTK